MFRAMIDLSANSALKLSVLGMQDAGCIILKQNYFDNQINLRTGDEKLNMYYSRQGEGDTIRYASPLLMRPAKSAGSNAACVVKKQHKNVRNVLAWAIQLHCAIQK